MPAPPQTTSNKKYHINAPISNLQIHETLVFAKALHILMKLGKAIV